VRSDIPPQIEKVVLKALEKRKEDRQSSALELAAELEEALYGAGVNAQPSGAKASSITREYAAGRQKKETDQTGKNTVAFTAQRTPPPPSSNVSTAGATVPLGAIKAATPTKSIESTRQSAAKTTVMGDDGATRADVAVAGPTALDQTTVGLKTARNRYWLLAIMAVVIIAGLTWSFRKQIGLVSPAGPNVPDAVPVEPGMILVMGGTFNMGTDDPNLDQKFAAWKPAHPVTVKSFYLDEKEVTNDQYSRFIRQTGYGAPPSWKDGTFPP